jgi:hypothetical protein
MTEKNLPRIQYTVLFLMIFAAIFHLIQLPLFPVDFRWYITLTGFILYTVASLGVSQNKEFGFYLSILFPVIGGCAILIIYMIAAITDVTLLIFNLFTALAAIVEIPAVFLSIIYIRANKIRQMG